MLTFTKVEAVYTLRCDVCTRLYNTAKHWPLSKGLILQRHSARYTVDPSMAPPDLVVWVTAFYLLGCVRTVISRRVIILAVGFRNGAVDIELSSLRWGCLITCW